MAEYDAPLKDGKSNNSSRSYHQQQQPQQHGQPVDTIFFTNSTSSSTTTTPTTGSQVAIYRKTPSLGNYQTIPISKHYAVNNQILDAFEIHYENSLYTVAYAIGLKFLETALLEIPKHGYFYSKRHDQERMQSSLDAIRVSHLLKEIIDKLQIEKQQQGRNITTSSSSTTSTKKTKNRHFRQHDSDDEDDDEEEDPAASLLQASELLKVEKLHQLALEQCEIASVAGEHQYEQKRKSVQLEIEALNGDQPSGGSTYPSTSSISRSNSRSRSNGSVGDNNNMIGENDGFRGGGGDRNNRGSIVAFGDSMSNVFYNPPPPLGGTLAPINQDELLQSPIVTGKKGKSSTSSDSPRKTVAGFGSFNAPTPDPPTFGRKANLGMGAGSGAAAAAATGTEYRSMNVPPPPPLSSFMAYSSQQQQPKQPKPASSVIDESATITGELHPNMAVAMAFPEPPKHERASSDLDLQRALYLSGLEVTMNHIPNNSNNYYGSNQSINMFDSFMMDAIPERSNHNNDSSNHNSYSYHQDQPVRRQEREQQMANDKFWQDNSSGTDDLMNHPHLKQHNHNLAPPPQEEEQPPLPGTTESRRGSLTSTTGGPPNRPPMSRFSIASSSMKRQSSLTSVGGNGLSINMLMDCYHEDFDALRSRGRVRVSTIDTYQGRVPNSANGCTIIAPLLCIHHFHNDKVLPDPGLPDAAIVQVIDEETPNILPKVRDKLGLKKDAFIIPSDAHDCLMEQHYMCQEQFVSVCGGNILDETHIQPMVDALKALGPKKLAASVFFHEHVITILQLKRSSTEVWYDMIDSLPHVQTLARLGEESILRPEPTSADYSSSEWSTMFNSSGADTAPSGTFRSSSDQSNTSRALDHPSNDHNNSHTMGSVGHLTRNEGSIVDLLPPELLQQHHHVQNAVRIRCLDEECLKATLRWYSCSVFTDENKAYIDSYKWDEKRLDFDPRVFQAFIWREA